MTEKSNSARTAGLLLLGAVLALAACGDVEPFGWHRGNITGHMQHELQGKAIWCADSLGGGDTLYTIRLGEVGAENWIEALSGRPPSTGARWTVADTLPAGDADATLVLPRLRRNGREYRVRSRAGHLIIRRVTPDSVYGEFDLDVAFWDEGPAIATEQPPAGGVDTVEAAPPGAAGGPAGLVGTGDLNVYFAAARWKNC